MRLIVGTSSNEEGIDRGESGSDSPNTYHVRDDLVGRVVEFDGDRVTIDFKRLGT